MDKVKAVLKNLIDGLLTALTASISGPWAWLVKVLINPVSSWLAGLLARIYEWLKLSIEEKVQEGKDKKDADKYENTLKDGANEQDQIDATGDLLNNGGVRKRP